MWCKVIDRLQDRGHAFRLDASEFNNVELKTWMVMECDSKPISEDPSRKLEMHCFPSHGSEVKRIDDHKKYDALVTFLLWFYRTDQRVGEASGYNSMASFSAISPRSRS